MGVGALKKHSGGEGHKKRLEQYMSTLHHFPAKQKQVMSDNTTVAQSSGPEEKNEDEVVYLEAVPGNEKLNSKEVNPIPTIFSVQSGL